MGFISNQWLTGWQRDREYGPVDVTFESEIEDPDDRDEWSTRNNVVVELCARRRGGDCHVLLFTPKDLGEVLPVLVKAADTPTRRRIAGDILVDFGDAELLDFLRACLSRRPSK
jgi:hypothetical protein